MQRFKSSMQRIYSLIIKESISIFNDPKVLFVLIMPPLLQLLIFSFSATLDVKNVRLAVLNQDYGKHGYELVQRISGSPVFSHLLFPKNEAAIQSLIDEQAVLAAVIIPLDFSRRISAHRMAHVRIILDGRHSNATQIVNGYFSTIINQYNQSLTNKNSVKTIRLIQRNWFNPNLLYIWYNLPCLICILSMLISLALAALSIARERELGTLDQLLVSPLTSYEIIMGKTIPAVIIGMLEGFFFWLAAVFLFKIPCHNSVLLLLFALFCFIMSTVGIGLFISVIANTQQQAFLGLFFYMVPAVLLSGYASPVENMPVWLQYVTWFDPLKHILIIVKGLFLKDLQTIPQLLINTYPLILIGLITLPFAAWRFKKHRE